MQSLVGTAPKLLSAWLRLSRLRWHVIYPNGVCSQAMRHVDAVAIAGRFGGRISKS